MTDQPSLPYSGTEGYSGTDTSRALAEDTAPTAKSRQDAVLAYVRSMRSAGATVGGVRDNVEPHHGAASRSLTNLHIAGRLARLTATHNNAKIYVAPEFVEGRDVEKYQGTAEKHRRQALEEIREKVATLPYSPGLGWSGAISAVIEEIDLAIEGGQ